MWKHSLRSGRRLDLQPRACRPPWRKSASLHLAVTVRSWGIDTIKGFRYPVAQ
jgi:hypothetical protein